MTRKAKKVDALAGDFEAAWKAERDLPDTATNAEVGAAVERTGAFIDQIIDSHSATNRQLALVYLWRQEDLWPELETLFERLGALPMKPMTEDRIVALREHADLIARVVAELREQAADLRFADPERSVACMEAAEKMEIALRAVRMLH